MDLHDVLFYSKCSADCVYTALFFAAYVLIFEPWALDRLKSDLGQLGRSFLLSKPSHLGKDVRSLWLVRDWSLAICSLSAIANNLTRIRKWSPLTDTLVTNAQSSKVKWLVIKLASLAAALWWHSFFYSRLITYHNFPTLSLEKLFYVKGMIFISFVSTTLLSGWQKDQYFLPLWCRKKSWLLRFFYGILI